MKPAVLLFLVVNLGCSAYQARGFTPDHDGHDLPAEPEKLIAIADESALLGPGGPDLDRSRAAAERLLEIEPNNGEAAWRAARALFHLAMSDDTKAERLSARCIDVSEVAVKNTTRAEPFYFHALCMGARAQARYVEGLDLVKRMVASGKRAVELDERTLHGGPHRLLGGIYLRAPAWPASVGDLDAALEHLERAIEIAPDWAENHLLLAEALLEDDREEEARAALDRAKALMDRPEAEGWRATWQQDVAKVEARLR